MLREESWSFANANQFGIGSGLVVVASRLDSEHWKGVTSISLRTNSSTVLVDKRQNRVKEGWQQCVGCV